MAWLYFFGSKLGTFENASIHFYSKLFTYVSFLLFGIIGFLPEIKSSDGQNSLPFLRKLSELKINYIFVIAFNILIGEFGDKTFLASLGLGLQYPNYKLPLILGSIMGMVLSNSIALCFGKFLGTKLKPKFIEFLSNIIFIIFGLLGLINIF